MHVSQDEAADVRRRRGAPSPALGTSAIPSSTTHRLLGSRRTRRAGGLDIEDGRVEA
jgi:hypothetical protein